MLDLAYLASQTFGDNELESELLQLFVAQAKRLVPKLARDDSAERADTAHLLKGSARAVGARYLAEVVDAYDQARPDEQGENGVAYRSLASAFAQTEAAIAARLSELQA